MPALALGHATRMHCLKQWHTAEMYEEIVQL